MDSFVIDVNLLFATILGTTEGAPMVDHMYCYCNKIEHHRHCEYYREVKPLPAGVDAADVLRIDELRFERGKRAALAGKPPSESWPAYLEGYNEGVKEGKPGARWTSVAKIDLTKESGDDRFDNIDLPEPGNE
jgi:hypothetical protein